MRCFRNKIFLPSHSTLSHWRFFSRLCWRKHSLTCRCDQPKFSVSMAQYSYFTIRCHHLRTHADTMQMKASRRPFEPISRRSPSMCCHSFFKELQNSGILELIYHVDGRTVVCRLSWPSGISARRDKRVSLDS